MELATGGDLFSLVLGQSLEESDVRVIMGQVATGVQYLHRRGVVHRDVKPENILLTSCPKVGHRVAIADFSSSAVRQGGRMRSAVGTSGYKAP